MSTAANLIRPRSDTTPETSPKKPRLELPSVQWHGRTITYIDMELFFRLVEAERSLPGSMTAYDLPINLDFALKAKGYEIVSFLGAGTFSMAFKIRSSLGEHFALKVFNPSVSPKDFKIEWQLLSTLQRLLPEYVPRLITSIDFTYAKASPRGQEKKGNSLVMSYHRASLHDLLVKLNATQERKFLPETTLRKILFKLLSALAKLELTHEHLDIKPQNIVIDPINGTEEIDLKLIDFGSTLEKDTPLASVNIETLFYRSPKVLHQQARGVDTFSAGCTLFELLTSQHLFVTNPATTSMMERSRLRNHFFVLKTFSPDIAPDPYALLDTFHHFVKVFRMVGKPSEEFILQIPEDLRFVFFDRPSTEKQHTFRLPFLYKQCYLKNRLSQVRTDLPTELLDLYIDILRKLLNYENPPTAGQLLSHSLFHREELQQAEVS